MTKSPTIKAAKQTKTAAADRSAERMARGPLAVGAVAGRVTRPILGKRGLAEGDILGHWASVVGEVVARYAIPERVSFPRGRRDGGELVIRVASGPFAIQLQHDAPRVIERINAYFGYPAIARIKLMQAPLPVRRAARGVTLPPLSESEESALQSELVGITDPDLRASLERLGRSMRQRAKVQGS